jgi:hypothetical protein
MRKLTLLTIGALLAVIMTREGRDFLEDVWINIGGLNEWGGEQ